MTQIPVGVGLVIGCYQYPKLVEAQIRLIRLFNHDYVPILLAGDGGRNAREKRPFYDLGENYPGVTVRLNKRRLGHYHGDLEVFRQGTDWAFQNGYRFLCKLSQRYIILRDWWLYESACTLAESDHILLGNDCLTFGRRHAFPLRTEAVILDVPCYYGCFPTEVTNSVEHTIFNLHPYYLPWDLVPNHPNTRIDEVLWRQSHTEEEYQAVCREVDIELDERYDCLPWFEKMNYKR